MNYFITLLFLALVVFGCSLPKDTVAGTATEAGNPEIADGSSSSQLSVSSFVSSSVVSSSSIVSSSSMRSSVHESSSMLSSSSKVVPVNLATIEGVLLNELGDPAAFMPFEFRLDSILPQENLLLKKSAIGGVQVNDTTDAEGTYRIEQVLPGKYIIQTSPDSISNGVRIPVTVSKNENVVVEPVQFKIVGTLKFEVEPFDYKGGTAKIELSGVNKEYTLEFDGTAEAKLLILVPPGDYTGKVIVTGDAYAEDVVETKEFTIESGLETEWEIYM